MSSTAWKRYNIFLSSTFKDMDFERDVIKFRVIPALNRRFRDRRIELQGGDALHISARRLARPH